MLRLLRAAQFAFCAAATLAPLAAQENCSLIPVAGVAAGQLGDNGPAPSAFLFEPTGVDVDSTGFLFIADKRHHRIRRVTSDGIITTVAGVGRSGFSGDGGPAIEAALMLPEAVLAAPGGVLYIADTGNHRIRRVTPDGIIATVAGTGHPGFSGDGGPAKAAELNSPHGMSLDSHGALYFADTNNHRIRRVAPDGTIDTLAGAGASGFSGDEGPAIAARLSHPRGVTVAPDGVFYIADTDYALVRKVTLDGVIHTVAGVPVLAPPPKFPAPAATTPLSGGVFNVVLLPDGSLLIPTFQIARLSPDGATLTAPYGNVGGEAIAVDAQGRLYAVTFGDVITRYSLGGAAEVWAGHNRYGAASDGASALGAVLNGPAAIAAGPDHALYVADRLNHSIDRIAGGVIRKFASARGPVGIGFDAAGSAYFADYDAQLIRKIAPDGAVTTIAGGGGGSNIPLVGSPAVSATSVSLVWPIGLAVHANGVVDAAIYQSYRGQIVRITPDGKLRTLYSTSLSLAITHFHGMAVDANDNLLVPSDANVIFSYDAAGSVTTVATHLGNTTINGIAAGSDGSVYLSDSKGRIHQMDSRGVAVTLYNRDLDQYTGPATQPDIPEDSGISLAVDPQGALYASFRELHAISQFASTACAASNQPTLDVILPAAHIAASGYAPGELISLYGASIGPATPAGPVLDANGMVPQSLGGVRVLFEGVPGPVLYASTGQINAIVPFTMYGWDTVRVAVERDGVLSDASSIPMTASSPAIFQYTSQGSTRSIVVNPNGSLNNGDNPAPAGSYVTIYVTGLGRTSPEGVDGRIAGLPLGHPISPVTVDPPYSLLYAGTAYGIVEGVCQINLQVPSDPFFNQASLHAGGVLFTVGVALR